MPSFIDFERKLIFCHITKCAGTSFSNSYSLISRPSTLLISQPDLSLSSRFKKRLIHILNCRSNYLLDTDFDFGSKDLLYLKKIFLMTAQIYGTHLPPSALVDFISQYLSISPKTIFSNWTFVSIIRQPSDRLVSYINYVKASKVHHLHKKFKNVSKISCAVDIFNSLSDDLSLFSTLGEYPFEFNKCFLFDQSELPSILNIPLNGNSISVKMPYIRHYQVNPKNLISLDIHPSLALKQSRWFSDEKFFARLQPLILNNKEIFNAY